MTDDRIRELARAHASGKIGRAAAIERAIRTALNEERLAWCRYAEVLENGLDDHWHDNHWLHVTASERTALNITSARDELRRLEDTDVAE